MADEFVTIRNKKNKDDVWVGPAESAEALIANGHWERAPKGVQPVDPSNPDTAPIDEES